MKTNRKQLFKYAVFALIGLVVLAIVFLPQEDDKAREPRSQPILVCIDSTESTDDVRDKYQVDLEKVVRQAAFHQDHLLAAACGANATGEVDWPVGRFFRATYSEDFANQELEKQADIVIDGNEEKEGIVDLLEIDSKETTPMGEMLAVTARQCDGGGCQIYFFTDGEWADDLLRVKDGVSDEERERYVDAYADRLEGLEGSTVHFIGVGLGTVIGEVALDEAKSVAKELVEEAGGEMGYWKTRL